MQRENNNNKEKMPRLGLEVDRGRKGRKKKELGLEVIKENNIELGLKWIVLRRRRRREEEEEGEKRG